MHELPLTQQIILSADRVKEFAYCPYSKFKVGASILTTNHNIYSGCNVESCSFGATLCAEGSAIANMVSNGETTIAEIAVTSSSEKLCYPCGLCLQKIAEFAEKDTVIHICINKEIKATFKLYELLPFKFNETIFA